MLKVIPDKLLPYKKRLAKYRPAIEQVCIARDIPTSWGLAFCRQESCFKADPPQSTDAGDIRRGGAYGLFQMTLATAQGLGYHGDGQGLLLPATNIALWAALVTQLRKRFGADNLKDVAAGYNSGHSYAEAPQERTRNPYTFNVVLFAKEFGWTGPGL